MPANSTSEAMHVLHLSSWYPNGPDSRNGIFIIRQVEALALGGAKCGIVAGPLSDQHMNELQKKEERGVWHYIHPYAKGSNPVVQAWRQFVAMWKAIQAYLADHGKPDVVVVHVAWKAGWWALWLHYRYNSPIVLAEHWSGYLPENPQFKGFKLRYLTQLVANRAEFIVCPSALLATAMQAHHLKNRYEIIPNVVDTDVYRIKSSKQHLGYFLHVSNLAPVKRFDLVLARFHRFRQFFPRAELKVAGAFDVNMVREKFAAQLEGVQLLGVQSPSDLARLYSSANALILCSEFETFSIVVPEALACGCTVIAPDLPALRQHLQLGPLQLIAPDDVQAWDAAMANAWNVLPGIEAPTSQDAHPYSPEMVGKLWMKQLKRITDVA